MKKNLTDMTVQKLAPGVYFDTKTPAFGIRIGKRRKTWIATKGRQRSVITLGHYPSLSLQEARKKALIELGSPLVVRSSLTFPEAKAMYLGQGKWRPRSKKVLESSLAHFTWTKTLAKITHEDVATALDAIEGPSARAHALKDIRSFFNWCVPRYLDSNPAEGLKATQQKARSRVLTDDELKRVWTAAENAGTFGKIVRLLILTGQRKTEIGSLTWPQVRPEDIYLPEDVTKNGRSHTVPLESAAASIIAACPRRNSTPYLFTATGSDAPYNGYAYHLKKLKKASQTTDWTLHDLRRTFATGLAALGVPIHVTEKLLNHVSGSTGGLVGVYQRFEYWDEQKEALARWEAKLQSIVRPV